MQLLQLFLLAGAQLTIHNAYSSPLMRDYISQGRAVLQSRPSLTSFNHLSRRRRVPDDVAYETRHSKTLQPL